MYSYSRLVTGLPQRQMEDLLKQRKQKDNTLLGKVVMTMGLELRRAYVNDMTVLPNGTLVSVLDDGHVQLWKNGAVEEDVIHDGNADLGGVDSVVTLGTASFVTAGRGSMRLWNRYGRRTAAGVAFATVY